MTALKKFLSFVSEAFAVRESAGERYGSGMYSALLARDSHSSRQGHN
jgi:hypothetical protein